METRCIYVTANAANGINNRALTVAKIFVRDFFFLYHFVKIHYWGKKLSKSKVLSDIRDFSGL